MERRQAGEKRRVFYLLRKKPADAGVYDQPKGGIAGAVAARVLAEEQEKSVLVLEKKAHIGGNCYDEEDNHGVLIHRYGPHIFHTSDEGKGKITDMFASKADIVIRFQGGANAGHTIINEHGRFALHLMPSGVCSENATCIIGNGVALDINKFINELEEIKKAGLNPKLLVSERCQILMPYHILLDEYEEERLGKAAFGSTKSGIAPFFSDKYAKIGIQVNELFDDETLKAKIKNICTLKNLTLKYVYNKPLLDEDELFAICMDYKKKIAPFVCDTHTYIQNAIKEGKEILLEGQLGTLKDPDFGIYPMVTSSSTLAGYGCVWRRNLPGRFPRNRFRSSAAWP